MTVDLEHLLFDKDALGGGEAGDYFERAQIQVRLRGRKELLTLLDPWGSDQPSYLPL